MELETKGDCYDSAREDSYIRTLNLCRTAQKVENGRDNKEALHTPWKKHAHTCRY